MYFILTCIIIIFESFNTWYHEIDINYNIFAAMVHMYWSVFQENLNINLSILKWKLLLERTNGQAAITKDYKNLWSMSWRIVLRSQHNILSGNLFLFAKPQLVIKIRPLKSKVAASWSKRSGTLWLHLPLYYPYIFFSEKKMK